MFNEIPEIYLSIITVVIIDIRSMFRVEKMDYKERISDDLLKKKLGVFGAVLITGPKGCGKTTTAKNHARSIVEFQDEDKRSGYLSVAEIAPSKLLEGDRPRLLDEWQDAPKVWGAVRKSVDDLQKPGQYILTGSVTGNVDTPHTGTLRISRMRMYPMSLYESGESNGTVSLKELFDDPDGFTGCHSELDIDGIIYAICRGGWPYALNIEDREDSCLVAKDLFAQTCDVDISRVDGVRRNPTIARALLHSYSRNICQLADNKTIIADVRSNNDLSDATYYSYVQALERLYIIEDVEAWSPAIRSKTAIRTKKKKNLVDPSVAVSALGIGPEYFNSDFQTLGFLFESLCIRDLRIYSSKYGGTVSHYHDDYGLEADAVIHLEDGRYALCEIELGQKEVEKGAKNLMKLESLICGYNEKHPDHPLRPPTLKIVLTGTEYGYRRDDGVLVIPIACLKD